MLRNTIYPLWVKIEQWMKHRGVSQIFLKIGEWNERFFCPGGPACNARSSRPYRWVDQAKQEKKSLGHPVPRSTRLQMFHYDRGSFITQKAGLLQINHSKHSTPKKPEYRYDTHGSIVGPKWFWWILSRKSSQVNMERSRPCHISCGRGHKKNPRQP